MSRLKKLRRRDVLAGGSAAGVLLACGGKRPEEPTGPRQINPQEYDGAVLTDFAPASVAQDDSLFSLGIQAGAMTEGSALLWTFAQEKLETRLRVWRDAESPSQIHLAKNVLVPYDSAGYAKIPVDTLAPATWYRYAFFQGDTRRSPIGKFRTAWPPDWSEPLTVAASTCTHFRNMPYASLVAAARQPIDAFLHLGDISYNDGSSSIDSFRQRWHQTLKDPGYRAVLAQAGWYATWDDHEITNNFNPETVDPTLLATGKAAFFETLAVEPGPSNRLWRSYRWGGTAEFFVLDSRTERKPSTRETPDAQYLSPEQLAWLQESLAASPAHFKVLLNSVPIANLTGNLWGGQADRWQGYAAQREKLLAFIDANDIKNVFFVAGDFHMGSVHRLEKSGPRRRMWEVMAGPGANGPNPITLVWESPENRETAFPKAQFNYVSGNFAVTTLTFNPKDDSVVVRFIDPATDAVSYEARLTQEL